MQRRITSRNRGITVAAAALSAAFLLASCAPPGSSEPTGDPEPDGAVEAQEFNVGLLTSQTGFASATGTDMINGWNLYWDLNGTTVGNFEVDWVIEDDASDPQAAIDKATRLVDEVGVDAVVGPILANNAIAVADYLDGQGVANLSQTSADDITQRASSPYVIRTGAFAGSQATFAAGQWAADEGYMRAATICPDYAFGWDNCGGFSSAYLAAGGEIVQQLWYPQGTSDLATYATQLSGLDVDVIFAGTTGGTDAIGFLQSAGDYGILESTPVITGAATTSSNPLAQVGEGSVGVNSVTYYSQGNDTPVNNAFREAYEEAYDTIPSVYASGAYLTAQLLAAVLADATSKPTGSDLVDAIKATAPEQDDLVWGSVSFDEYNGVVAPLYVNVVEQREDGQFWNVVEKQYDDVSQFWTFDPDEWLANPTFSQSFTHQ